MSEVNLNPNKNHQKVYAPRGQRISGCGQWVFMSDGSRFKRTTLPSVATGTTATQEDVLYELTEEENRPTFQEQ